MTNSCPIICLWDNLIVFFTMLLIKCRPAAAQTQSTSRLWWNQTNSAGNVSERKTQRNAPRWCCVSGDKEGLCVYLRGTRTSCILPLPYIKPRRPDFSWSPHKVRKAQKLLPRKPGSPPPFFSCKPQWWNSLGTAATRHQRAQKGRTRLREGMSLVISVLYCTARGF